LKSAPDLPFHLTSLVYINLPIGIAALAFLWYFLRHVELVRKLPDGTEDKRPSTEVLKHTLKSFDYIGW
jgi:hypothetical protein